jgi:hypothetical protein
MKHALLAAAAVVGVGLVAAAGIVLVDGTDRAPATPVAVSPVAARQIEGGPIRVEHPLLVVNRDGSATVGAQLQNPGGAEVSLMGVTVSVDGRRVPVNSTEMWLPVPPDDPATVGAASDAGGFVVPEGIDETSAATLEFWFDDGTCVPADVQAVSRGGDHRQVYPKSRRSIGPETTSEPPAGLTSCAA